MSEKELKEVHLRRFYIERKGNIVAEGTEFTNGVCVLSWLSFAHSVEVHSNIKELFRLHGHHDDAVVRWIDGPRIGVPVSGSSQFDM